MSIPPLPNEEKERLASLQHYAILGTPPEASLDRLAALAARLFEMPVAFVTLVDSDRLWFKSCQGPCGEHFGQPILREDAFCAFTILSHEVLVVEDARLDPRFAGNPLVIGVPGLRFYAGAPLIGSEGQVIGALCVLDFQPRTFSTGQQATLQDLAASVVSELDLHRVAATLAESERLYRQMFEDSPQAMWVFDVETLRFLAVNDTAVAHYGYSRDEFLSRKLSDLRHPDDLAAMLQSIGSEAIGTRFAGLCRNFKKNGDLIWTEIVSHAIQFEGHTARLTVATDVTERKNAEDALRRSLSMMQAQQDSDPDGILVIDENCQVTGYNPRLHEMWSLPEHLCNAGNDLAAGRSLTGGDNSRLLHHLQPLIQDRETLPFSTEFSKEMSREKLLYEIVLPDGRCFDCSSSPILSNESHYYGRLWVFRDVTERKNAENVSRLNLSILKAQQEAALDGILVVDANRRIISYNQRLCELWQTPQEIIQSGDDEKHLHYVLSLMANPDEFLQKVLYLYDHPSEHSRDEIVLRDGRTLDRYSGPIISQDGKSLGRIWYFRDVTERKKAENALRWSEERLSLHIQQTPLAALEVAADMTILSWNPAAESTFGYTAQEAIGQNVVQLLVPTEEHAHLESIRQGILTQSGGRRSTNHNRTKSGEIILCEWYNTPLVDENGQSIACASLAHDVTESHRAQEELRLSKARMEEAQRVAHIGCWDYDLHSGKSRWTREMFHLLGLDPALGEPEYQANLALYHPEDATHLQECIKNAVSEGTGYALDIRVTAQNAQAARWLHAIGRPVFDDAGKVTRLFGTLMDITAQKCLETEREALLAQTETLLAEALAQADRDPLTGLLNHRVFHKRLKEKADSVHAPGSHFAVLLLDLADFNFFNEVYGHQAGDDVLRQMTQVLQSLCRKDDVLARFGGDEFALLLPDVDRMTALSRLDQLRAAASFVSYCPPGYEMPIPLSFSVGLACFPEDGTSRTALLESASNSLRVAKSGGDEGNLILHLRQGLSQAVGGFSMLDALVTAVDNKDRYTRQHSEDVLQYSLQIAEALGMDAKTQQTVKIAALLHDVGKIGVPDAVLRKPGRLTDDEFEAIKQHPMMGSIIVGAIPGFEETLDAVRHHHERWDGGGYPFGLIGKETPLTARLMAVADAYSAMTTDRPYRKGMAEERALQILAEGAGTQWDPECVQAFLQARGAIYPCQLAA